MIRLVGVVQVPLDCLQTLELGQRIYDPDRCDYLAAVFDGHCINPERANNQIDGIILEQTLQEILLALLISVKRLEITLTHGPYPEVFGHNVYYLQGRHRLEAAKRSRGVLTWVVRLHVTDSWQNFLHDETRFIKSQTDWYSHEREWSDGDIYIKLRDSQLRRDESTERQFTVRLGPMKRFPGLLQGLKLGMWYKYCQWLHLDPEVTAYMQRIARVCAEMTDGVGEFERCMDVNTIRTLEGRLPSSAADRQVIQRGFSSGKLFPKVTDKSWRERIEYNVLKIPVLIPSLKSFHENMKVLSTAAQIVKNHLLPDHTREKGTLQQQLQEFWNPPARLVVEISEGQFRYGVGPSSFDVAYVHLMLAAIRQFPSLQHADSPRVSRGKAPCDKEDVSMSGTDYEEDPEEDVVMQDSLSEKSSSSNISERTMKLRRESCGDITTLKFNNAPLPRMRAVNRQTKSELTPDILPLKVASVTRTHLKTGLGGIQGTGEALAARKADRSDTCIHDHPNANFLPQGPQLQRISSTSQPFTTFTGQSFPSPPLVPNEQGQRFLQPSSRIASGEAQSFGYVQCRASQPSTPQSHQQTGSRTIGLSGLGNYDLKRISSSQGHQSMIATSLSPCGEIKLKRISSLQSSNQSHSSITGSSSTKQPQRISSSHDVRSMLPSYLPWQVSNRQVKSEEVEMAIDSMPTHSPQIIGAQLPSSLNRVQSRDTVLSDQYHEYNFNAAIDSSDPFSFDGSSITTRSTLLSFPGDRAGLNHGLDGIQGFDDSEDSMIL
ncbi:hypothetical protein CCUS01_16216 [Colletotrichum cuscutae]|uniref:Uncharacterized protein n=1 Tax=Colletotrichum cuscutae TaxID=1209917 RepID=A0AAI9VER3_9PEZI|nr:hypothetical protein CCUS01_16216 [Colletotrichum cuscutae]